MFDMILTPVWFDIWQVSVMERLIILAYTEKYMYYIVAKFVLINVDIVVKFVFIDR